MTDGLHPSARLLRGFATDFLTCHDPAVVPRIMDPAYQLNIGGHVLAGRDHAYAPATVAQLDQFPGLIVTVHDVLVGPDMVAMRFTEHGVSRKHAPHAAAWGGVTLFQIENGRLRHGWAEEDYFARKRQLASGVCDLIRPPASAPWDTPCLAPDLQAEAVARTWLEDPRSCLDGEMVETIDCHGPLATALIAPLHVQINAALSAGPRVAFQIDVHGAYAGGFDDIPTNHVGYPVILRFAGLLDTAGNRVTRAQIVADRLGLQRSLLGAR